MIKWIAGLFLAAAIGLAATSGSAERGFPLSDMKQASVIVYHESGPDYGHGSGVIIGPATVITAGHVAEGETKLLIEFDDGERRMGTILYQTMDLDYAVVQVPVPDRFKPAHVSCREPVWGEAIAAVGNPLDIFRAVSFGHVSALNVEDPDTERKPMPGLTALDITITWGNSGGPVFDQEGNVLGLVIMTQLSQMGQTGFQYMNSVEEFCSNLPI